MQKTQVLTDGLAEAVTLAQTSGFAAGGSLATELTVLVHRIHEPVGLRVSPDSLQTPITVEITQFAFEHVFQNGIMKVLFYVYELLTQHFFQHPARLLGIGSYGVGLSVNNEQITSFIATCGVEL